MSDEMKLDGFGLTAHWDWNDKVSSWNKYRFKDYFRWVEQTFGEEEVIKGFVHLDEYRAVMDVKQSVKGSPIEKKPTKILTSAAFLAEAQQILNESLREAVEENEHNLTGL
jgi:hypothetical protein